MFWHGGQYQQLRWVEPEALAWAFVRLELLALVMRLELLGGLAPYPRWAEALLVCLPLRVLQRVRLVESPEV
tara:strand:+ start:280 stop:495 length:216 start_codon:yes stop_codon:yes gene_type:complete